MSYMTVYRLVPSRLHELHESKFSFASRIELNRSKLSIFLLMYLGSLSGITDAAQHKQRAREVTALWSQRSGGGGGPDAAVPTTPPASYHPPRDRDLPNG